MVALGDPLKCVKIIIFEMRLKGILSEGIYVVSGGVL